MTLDLSSVTDALLDLVSNDWSAAPIWTELSAGGFTSSSVAVPNFTGLAPDQAITQPGPQLGLYLYHLETNHASEALFWQPQLMDPSLTGEPVRFLPLAFDAYYLLYAYSEDQWIEEQQMMSVALRVFHTQPIVRSPAGVTTPWELTLTPEHRSYDELSRLWQATTAPLRMSLVYRAAVIFLDPDQTDQASNLVSQVDLTVNSMELDPPNPPTLVSTSRLLTYTAPGGTTVTQTLSPASMAEGQTISVLADSLGGAAFSHVYLTDATGNESDVTAWVDPAQGTPSSLELQPPSLTSATTPVVPPPGIYQLALGSGTPGAVGSFRSQSLLVGVAPWVDPSAGPTLAAGTAHTLKASGLTAGNTTVLVGTTPLEVLSTGSPAAGQVVIDPAGTQMVLNPPAGTPGTLQPVVVQVNQVQADPALWVQF
jgi:Pvc16 N-terminal domain